MKTVLDASDRIFTIINNDASILALIDGMVYRNEPLSEDVYQKRNITVTPLSTSNDFINEHVVNVNCYAPDLMDGQADEVQLNAIAYAVILALETYGAVDDYCQLEVVSNNLIRSEPNRSYINIRVELFTE